jgi:hypothetical protein
VIYTLFFKRRTLHFNESFAQTVIVSVITGILVGSAFYIPLYYDLKAKDDGLRANYDRIVASLFEQTYSLQVNTGEISGITFNLKQDVEIREIFHELSANLISSVGVSEESEEKVTPARSGTKDNYITYQNHGPEPVVIDAQNGVRDVCIRVDGKQYLQFIGLRLTGACGPSGLRAGFYASDHSENLLLENISADKNRFGIFLHGKNAPVSRVTIRNCTMNCLIINQEKTAEPAPQREPHLEACQPT